MRKTWIWVWVHSLFPRPIISNILALLSKVVGVINGDVTHRIGVTWVNWSLASRVLCDKMISPKLNGNSCRMMVIVMFLYRTECWPVKNSHI